ncbi:MAG: FAD-dependent monooxygenase, partial [Desulfovibrionaceae bacterium]|nr:FAD-dependent monooxygenase [Desulfovibrionaceae bacterium]
MSANAPYDVLIVGTGPAGAAACLELAGKGLRVGVVDVGNTPPAHNIRGRFYDIRRAPGPNL